MCNHVLQHWFVIETHVVSSSGSAVYLKKSHLLWCPLLWFKNMPIFIYIVSKCHIEWQLITEKHRGQYTKQLQLAYSMSCAYGSLKQPTTSLKMKNKVLDILLRSHGKKPIKLWLAFKKKNKNLVNSSILRHCEYKSGTSMKVVIIRRSINQIKRRGLGWLHGEETERNQL